nr:MAG TPA: hypothetical protein [Caudoviricetes sp.]
MQGSGPKETASYLRVRCLNLCNLPEQSLKIPAWYQRLIWLFV